MFIMINQSLISFSGSSSGQFSAYRTLEDKIGNLNRILENSPSNLPGTDSVTSSEMAEMIKDIKGES